MNSTATSGNTASDTPKTTLRVWDLPTRLFHWALAAAVIGLIITGTRGGSAMEWHLKLGYFVTSLLIFRVVWGFIGGHWSRFVQFFYSPITIFRYLRGQSMPRHDIGHNPLGSLSVWALLVILIAQVSTGLISDDEIATQGPFARFVSSSVSLLSTSYHKHWGKWIIMTLVALHVCAILFYLFKKKQNLIKPMLNGDKAVPLAASSNLTSSKDELTQRVVALLLFVAIASLVFYTTS